LKVSPQLAQPAITYFLRPLRQEIARKAAAARWGKKKYSTSSCDLRLCRVFTHLSHRSIPAKHGRLWSAISFPIATLARTVYRPLEKVHPAPTTSSPLKPHCTSGQASPTIVCERVDVSRAGPDNVSLPPFDLLKEFVPTSRPLIIALHFCFDSTSTISQCEALAHVGEVVRQQRETIDFLISSRGSDSIP
jgi:hypothetical protein